VTVKARVSDPEALKRDLGRLARGEPSTYYDVCYDTPDGALSASGRELRVREIDAGGVLRTVLTYKAPPADEGSQSKPEHETVAASGGVIDVILSGLGLVHLAELEKRVVSYRFTSGGRDMLATMVTVPENDETFIELETPAREASLEPALRALRDALAVSGIGEDDLTPTPCYGPGRKPGPNQVPTPPDVAGPHQTSPDIQDALNCSNQTQCDVVRRNPAAWHAEGQGFESP
jgi:adenylate cyclase, class 2